MADPHKHRKTRCPPGSVVDATKDVRNQVGAVSLSGTMVTKLYPQRRWKTNILAL